MDLHAWIAQQVDRAEAQAHTSPDPTAALRRCEADRRVLARHNTNPNHADDRLHAVACNGCGTHGDCDDPATDNINDCPELLDLAHAHGATDETLAELERPTPPAPKPRTATRLNLADILALHTPMSDVPAALRGPHWNP